MSDYAPQHDWHTTVYLNKLIHGCHRSTNDPEKFFKAWGLQKLNLELGRTWNFEENSGIT